MPRNFHRHENVVREELSDSSGFYAEEVGGFPYRQQCFWNLRGRVVLWHRARLPARPCGDGRQLPYNPLVTSAPQPQTPNASGATSGGLADPLINLLIDGRYRVLSRMARGGMATVYVARDERLDRLVALKVMHPHLAESEQFTSRFKREARSAAKISHPSVVPIYDQGVVHGQGYLVMELVDGPDLRAFLSSGSSLTLGAALSYTLELLEGLAAAHRAGVVHRDLKPENVLMDPSGSLKIVDFGLARAASEVSYSTTGSIMGTVAYLAPEVALAGSSDARTDIFAVGIILYEMLTGELPGGGENAVQVALSRVNEDIPAPSLVTKWLPTEVDELVAAFCARDAAERPASALDAAAMVRRTQASLPSQLLGRDLPSPATSAPSSPAQGLTIPVGRADRTAVLPVERIVVQTSGSITAPEGQALTRKSRVWLILLTVLMLLVALALGTWWWWQQYGPGSYLDVPDLRGMTVEQAEEELSSRDLASTVAFDYSDTVPVDQIVETNPAAGEKVHRTQEIELVVSKGVLMLEVPETAGMEPEAAKAALIAAGFAAPQQLDEWSESTPEGEVIGTRPAAGEEVEHSVTVQLIVSKGREPISVPELLGSTQGEAEQTLGELGLVAALAEDFSADVPEGQVMGQTPQAGSTAHKGDTVNVVVSKGPPYAPVPDVYGKSTEEATRVLQDAGFEVEVNRIAGFFDSVGAQTPAAGESVRLGSVVQITVV